MNTYNVFENDKKVATVKAVSAERAIDKVETKCDLPIPQQSVTQTSELIAI